LDSVEQKKQHDKARLWRLTKTGKTRSVKEIMKNTTQRVANLILKPSQFSLTGGQFFQGLQQKNGASGF